MIPADNQLSTTIQEVNEQFLGATGLSDKLQVIFQSYPKLREAFFYLIGNAYNEQIHGKESVHGFGMTYAFSFAAKKYMVNLRNLVFEMQKAQASGFEEADYVSKLDDYMDKNTGFIIGELKQSGRVSTSTYKFQKNPWQAIRAQIEVLEDQVTDMKANAGFFPNLANGFDTIKAGFYNAVESAETGIAKNLELAKSYLQQLKEESAGTIHLEVPFNHQEFNRLDVHLENLPVEAYIPVDLSGNKLVRKPINFRLVTKDWLESEVSPMYYEIMELAEEARDELRMIRVNLMNAMKIDQDSQSNEIYHFSIKEIEIMLEGYIAKNRQNLLTVASLAAPMKSQLDQNLKIGRVFNSSSQFFSVSGLSYKDKVKTAGGSVRKTWKRFVRKQIIPLFDELFGEEEEDPKSLGEKLVEVTQYRSNIPYNYYSSIFLTKGLSGEGFWVKRPYFEEKVSNIYKKWKQGYRGAILVTGHRHSGKSIFMEMLGREYFERKIIRIAPDSKFEIDGRPFETSSNLEEVLAFIERNTPTSKSLFMIDDLELWQSAGENLGKNIQLLIRHIDKYAVRNFYLVSMGRYAYQHFNKYFKLERAFQDVLDLSSTKPHVLTEIIVRRHYSTHVTLFDEEKEELDASQLKTLSREIYDLADGNIGDALVLWTMVNQPNAEGKVINSVSKLPHLPDFLKPESAVVLDFLHLHKRSNEYHFRKSLGPAFSNKYEGVLNRLMHVGLIKRLPDGKLEINEYVVNEIDKQLTMLNNQ